MNDALERDPLEAAFLDFPSPEKRVCPTCGAPHFGLCDECAGCLSRPGTFR